MVVPFYQISGHVSTDKSSSQPKCEGLGLALRFLGGGIVCPTPPATCGQHEHQQQFVRILSVRTFAKSLDVLWSPSHSEYLKSLVLTGCLEHV
jgi:hypothetical protein